MRDGALIGSAADPAVQLLAAWLDGGPGWFAHPDGLGQGGGTGPIWFGSAETFLATVARLDIRDAPIRVVLRRDWSGLSGAGQAAQLALATARERGLPDIQCVAITEAAAAQFRRAGISVDALLKDEPGAAEADVELLDAPWRLRWRDRDRPLLLDQINLARIARHVPGGFVGAGGDAADVAALATAAGRASRAATGGPVLFMIPNGIGLGHLTRCLAMAEELPSARSVFWSYSHASNLIEEAGFEVISRPNATHLGAPVDDWRAWETAAFGALVDALQPAAIVVDGPEIDAFVARALAVPGRHAPEVVWVRRGQWRAASDTRRLDTQVFATRVIVPGELAPDQGPTETYVPPVSGPAPIDRVAPIVRKPGIGWLSRREARRGLGLGWGRTCLVSLGGDALADRPGLAGTIDRVARAHRVRLVWAISPLARRPAGLPDDADCRVLYPLTPFLEAFDGVISAAGYNSFHELMTGYDRPVLFAPVRSDASDDQSARARHAAAEGLALSLPEDGPITEALAEFFASVRAGTRIDRPRLESGAGAAAMLIAGKA